MDPDTWIGGPGGRFPATRRSAVFATRSEDPAERARAYETIVGAYWKPVYKYIRLKWRKSNEDAKDLTQAFFSRAFEKEFFEDYDPAKASFRTFLRVCLDGFVANEHKASHRLKRCAPMLSLDFESAEGELIGVEIADGTSLEEMFHSEWVRSVFGLAVDTLRGLCEESGKTVHFALFDEYDLGEGKSGYQEMASRYGLPVTQVTNYLAWVRREFRRIVLEKLQELTASEQEYRSEVRRLLGIDP